jgi:ABC-type transporter Mla subunit MlaD
MSPEEMQRTLQFLLQQQAQFVADSAASQARFDAGLEQVTSGLVGLTAIVGQVVDSVSQIAAAQKRTDEQLRATNEQLRATDARLSEHITSVESHLDVVIEMFERHLREDHGHRPS